MTEDDMRLNADTGRCVGAGQCVLTEPTVFDQCDDGVVVLVINRPEGEAAQRARHAVALCPSGALSVTEEVDDG
ncbi:(4Fe-4S)-binding protein [Salinispora arenicola]|nr:(4Fe-4S)-binding protein [Salinispora arenicola]NIL57187.1 ferredoxin [Salinispora arenicola]NIL62595.1 ferredoxin [Salinispora arenicola]